MCAKYYYRYCPEGTESRYELLVFYKDGPFLPLTDYYHDCIGRNDKSTANSYLNNLIPFFNWLDEYSNYQGKRVQWDDNPEVIRVAVEDYLMNEMYCKVREKDTFWFVNKTNKSVKTVSRFLSALKSFYKSLIRLKKYKYSNPMIDSYAILNEHKNKGVRKDKPRMPSEAGTEEPNSTRRLTDSYFKLINDEWQPEIIGDKFLPFEVYKAGKKVNWSLREQVIAHILFEGGARVSEVIELTIGDYRARNSFQEAETFNKGSHSKRVKFIRFSKDTTKLLMRYINKERAKYDEFQRTFDELPNDAPVFLTAVGTPFTRQSWYYHWKKAMDKCEMKLNPHKTRHWFVTTSMREIYETSKTDAEITKRKNQLIQYMKWSNKDTIQVYEHYFDEGKHREIHNQMFENMKKSEEVYLKQKKNKKTKKPKLKVLESVGKIEVDEDILEMLEGLE